MIALRGALALLFCVPLVVGCRAKDPPICPRHVAHERADEADTRMLEVDVWYGLLINGVSRRPFAVPAEPVHCPGIPVEVTLPPEQAAADPRAQASKLPRRALGDADITFGDATLPTDQLLWARIDYFDDGTAIGPVALARWDEKGLEIRGIGTLHAPSTRPSLRLESFGDEDSEEGIREVLVATGEACRGGETSGCPREVYLMPLIGQRFIQAGLYSVTDPGGPARVVLREVDEAELSDGYVRRAEVVRSVKYGGPYLQVSERVEQSTCPPGADATKCEVDEASDKLRTLLWDEASLSFIANEHSVWDGAQGGEL